MSFLIEYIKDIFPHLPYVNLEISNPLEEEYVRKQAEIDTGSPITVIRESLKNELDLESASEKSFGGFNSAPVPYDTYYVYVKIDSVRFELLEVISTNDPSWPDVLIGRDLINLWKMKLDGENYTGDFDIWSTNPTDVNP